MRKPLFLLLFIVLGRVVYAQTVTIRPNGALGFYSAGDSKGLSYSYGGKILLMANNYQRYGVLVNHLVLAGDSSYLSAGIFLEQVVFRYFNMGIGTVGYVGLADGNENSFGLYSHLGFEYPFAKRFHVLIAYQNDMIFARRFISNNALMLGIGIQFRR